jgi:hypothetical protein
VSGSDSCPAATGSSAITDCSAATDCAAAAGSLAAAGWPAVDLAGREEKLEPGGQLMLLARQSKSLVQGILKHLIQFKDARVARINMSQAASGMILQNHGRLPVSIFSAALGSLKRVTGRIFIIMN